MTVPTDLLAGGRMLRPALPTIGSSSKIPKRLFGLKRWLLCEVVLRLGVLALVLGLIELLVLERRLEP